MGWWKRWDEDLGSRKKFAAKLDEYMEDMDALVRLVDKEMKKIGRPYALVGKSNHNRGFRKGTVNFKFMVEMGEAVKLVFEKHGHHFYDWRGVADEAYKKGEWTMVDKLHQTAESNALQTAAFMRWTRNELGKEFAVNLDAQEKAIARRRRRVASNAKKTPQRRDARDARRGKRRRLPLRKRRTRLSGKRRRRSGGRERRRRRRRRRRRTRRSCSKRSRRQCPRSITSADTFAGVSRTFWRSQRREGRAWSATTLECRGGVGKADEHAFSRSPVIDGLNIHE